MNEALILGFLISTMALSPVYGMGGNFDDDEEERRSLLPPRVDPDVLRRSAFPLAPGSVELEEIDPEVERLRTALSGAGHEIHVFSEALAQINGSQADVLVPLAVRSPHCQLSHKVQLLLRYKKTDFSVHAPLAVQEGASVVYKSLLREEGITLDQLEEGKKFFLAIKDTENAGLFEEAHKKKVAQQAHEHAVTQGQAFLRGLPEHPMMGELRKGIPICIVGDEALQLRIRILKSMYHLPVDALDVIRFVKAHIPGEAEKKRVFERFSPEKDIKGDAKKTIASDFEAFLEVWTYCDKGRTILDNVMLAHASCTNVQRRVIAGRRSGEEAEAVWDKICEDRSWFNPAWLVRSPEYTLDDLENAKKYASTSAKIEMYQQRILKLKGPQAKSQQEKLNAIITTIYHHRRQGETAKEKEAWRTMPIESLRDYSDLVNARNAWVSSSLSREACAMLKTLNHKIYYHREVTEIQKIIVGSINFHVAGSKDAEAKKAGETMLDALKSCYDSQVLSVAAETLESMGVATSVVAPVYCRMLENLTSNWNKDEFLGLTKSVWEGGYSKSTHQRYTKAKAFFEEHKMYIEAAAILACQLYSAYDTQWGIRDEGFEKSVQIFRLLTWAGRTKAANLVYNFIERRLNNLPVTTEYTQLRSRVRAEVHQIRHPFLSKVWKVQK